MLTWHENFVAIVTITLFKYSNVCHTHVDSFYSKGQVLTIFIIQNDFMKLMKLIIFTVLLIMQSDVSGLLAYSLKVCMSLMQNKKFRNEVLRVLVKLYMNLDKPDFINVCQVTITSS